MPAATVAEYNFDQQRFRGWAEQDTADDGAIDFDDDLVKLVDDCMLHGTCYQLQD